MGTPFWALDTEGFEGPLYAPNPWDTCWVGGLQIPGIIRVAALPTQAADVQQPSDRDGAAIVMRGYTPGPIDIEIVLWTPEQWKVYQDVLGNVWKKPGKIAPTTLPSGKAADLARSGANAAEQAALDIIHPSLNGALGIKSIMILGVSVPVPTNDPKQGRVVHWKCLEYVPVAKRTALSKAKGSKSSSKGNAFAALATTENYSKNAFATPANLAVAPPSSTAVEP